MPAPPLTPLAAAVLQVPAPERALVVQCGAGDPVFFLAREFPAARIRGVDSSPERVRVAGGRVGLDPEGRVAFKIGSPRSLPYPDEFFDLLVQLDGHPVPAEIARVLRPGAHLILVTPRPRRTVAGLREKLTGARLARYGLVVAGAERAGDGSFLVARMSA